MGGEVNKHMLESVLGSFYFKEKKNAKKYLKLERGMWCERIGYICLVSENYKPLLEPSETGAVYCLNSSHLDHRCLSMALPVFWGEVEF